MTPRPALVSALFASLVIVTACGSGGNNGGDSAEAAAPLASAPSLDDTLRTLLAQNNVTVPARPAEPDAVFNLGLNLFQSTLLSGNRKVSCASCHPTGNAGVDNMSLAIGVNGIGGPPGRTGTPVIHRNTPDLLNKTAGNPEFMFWDGRVAYRDGVFTTPAGSKLPGGLANAAAAQALFPLLSRDEMLGPAGDASGTNELAGLNPAGTAVESDPQPVWRGIMARLQADTAFAGMLRAAYPEVPLDAMGIEYAANAIAAFEARRWYGFGGTNVLHGYIARTREIGDDAKRGGVLFFGSAGCVRCHTGPLLNDQKFHNLAVPQIGPGFGSGAGETPVRDKGRYEVTHDSGDLYAFLTPSLWEVKNTFPYFHDGIYSTLEEVIRHHLDAAATARAFRCPTELASGGNAVACRDAATAPALYDDMVDRLAGELRTPLALSDRDVADLVAFLGVLTDGNNNSPR